MANKLSDKEIAEIDLKKILDPDNKDPSAIFSSAWWREQDRLLSLGQEFEADYWIEVSRKRFRWP